MRKITLLLSLVFCVMLSQAQNLLTNPGFETWASGAPTGWTLPTNTYATVSQNTTLFSEGASSLKVIATPPASSGGTYTINQSIPVTPGKTYTLSMSYYIETGDGTDARIWCNFKNGATYLTDAEMTTAGLLEKLKGPGGSAANFYFPDVKGSWQTYSVDFVAPVGVTDFNFEFRTYKEPAIVYWDKMFFGEKTTGFNNLNVNQFSAVVSGKNLLLNNVANGSTVVIYSALGSKIQTSVIENGKVGLNNLTRGMYVVRVNNMTQKIMY